MPLSFTPLSAVDNHTVLGKSDLPQTLAVLFKLSLNDLPTPPDERVSASFELLRVAANLCMDHGTKITTFKIKPVAQFANVTDDNRSYLLEAQLPQAILSLLEGYADAVPVLPAASPFPLSAIHLKVVRTAIGVLLNASLGYGEDVGSCPHIHCSYHF